MNNIFQTHGVKKAHEILREPLKEKGNSVTFRVESNSFSDALGVHVNGRFGERMRITSDTTTLHVSRFTSLRKYVSDEIVLNYLIELAKSMNKKAIVFEYITNEIDEQNSRLVRIPTDELSLYLNAYSPDETYYYLNIQENFLENKIYFYKEIKRQLSQLQDKDKTVTYSVTDNGSIIRGRFYIEGFEGEIEIKLSENPFKLRIGMINFEEVIDNVEQFPDLLETAIEQCVASVKIESLINPPKKYTTQFVNDNFFSGSMNVEEQKIVDVFFNYLLTFMKPTEIEEQIMDINSLKKIQKYNTPIFSFHLFNHYFVLNKDTEEVNMYQDKQAAKETFIRLNNELQERRYQNELNDIQRKATEFDNI